jgi:hypothetical protein
MRKPRLINRHGLTAGQILKTASKSKLQNIFLLSNEIIIDGSNITA